MEANEKSPKPDFKVAIIGAGFAGLAAAHHLLKAQKTPLVIFERANEVGGTWRENIYPGCACDVSSHLYSFSFAPNPDWSRMYSNQAEIQDYLIKTTDNLGLRPFIRFNSEIIRTEFDESKGYWQLSDRQKRTYTAQIIIMAIGPLNRPNYPKIKGLENFQGKSFHSTHWDYSYDLKGKNVAVIGTGASAIQFIPQIASQVKKLLVFQRTPPWIVPKMDRKMWAIEKWMFRYLPFTQAMYRGLIYWFNELRGLAFLGNEKFNQKAKEIALKHLNNAIKDPKLRENLTPNYKIGCKRILISNDYYPAIARPNVDVITQGIAEVKENSIIGLDGTDYQVDAIIFGTGFVVSEYFVDLNVIGCKGRNLFAEWAKTGAEAYYGISISGYPNLLTLVGPNTGGGHNSIVHIIESQVNYVVDYLNILDKNGSDTYLDLKPEVQAQFNAQLQEKMTSTVWASGCKSWYMNVQGKNTTIWPGLNNSYRKKTKKVNPQDYSIIKVDKSLKMKEVEV